MKFGFEDYTTILDQTIHDFEHGLDSIIMNSVDTLEVGASFDVSDAIISLVSSGFLYSLSL